MGANAVTTVPVYTAGEILTASDLNITNSGIPVFATSVTRDAAFGGTGEKTLAEGQFAYLEDSNTTQYYDGAAWQSVGEAPAWIDYTPTWTNLTVGNATQDFRYWQLGKFVAVTGILTWGSTTSVTSSVSLSLPVTAVTYADANEIWGSGSLIDTGTETYLSTIFYGSTTTARLRVPTASGAFIPTTAVTNTVPFTWTTGDKISVNFFYEAA